MTMTSTYDSWLEGQRAADRPADPLDLVTWVQYKAAFTIAALALQEIADGTADPKSAASDAIRALRAEVRRFDETEPSWEPPAAAALLSERKG
jgi:hypothetical protein